MDPFSKVAKIQNPSGPNIASVGGATTQGSNPFSQFGNLNEEKKPADNRYQYQSSPESNSIYSGNNMRPPNGLGLGNANMMSNSPKLNNAQPNFQQQQQQQMGNKMMQNPMMTGFGASASPAMQPMATGTPIQNPMMMQTNNMMQQSNMQQQQQFPDAFGGINPFDNFQPRQQQPQQFQQSPMNQQQQMLQQQQQLRQPQNPNPFNF